MTRQTPEVITSGPLPYMLSTPQPTEMGSELWPVLFFLHGFDEGYPTPLKLGLTRHGPFKASSSSVATTEFIVVAPQLPLSGDFWHKYASEVRAIVRQVQKDNGGDPNRTFLTGFSFGGNGVLDLGSEQPDLWRALWPVDPTRVPGTNIEQDIWLSSGQISRFSEERFIQSLQLERLSPELGDRLNPGNRVYFDYMRGHTETATMAYQDDRIYRWLLSR